MTHSERRRRRPAVVVAITAALLAGACSASDGGTGPTTLRPTAPLAAGSPAPVRAPASHVDGAIVRGHAGSDYDVASSVVEVAQDAQAVIVGTVASWADGRVVRDGDDRRTSAAMEVVVAQSFTARGAAQTVFVEVQRGGVLVDDAGAAIELDDGASYDERSLADLERAVPVGTRVLVLAVEAPSDAEIAATGGGGKVSTSWSPPRAGAALLSPLPQGLLFEDADGTYVSGVADQSDVEHGQWPAAQPRTLGEGGPFEQLLAQLSTEFDPR
jgi:hypothetical protein